MDRLAAYVNWRDGQSYDQAVMVAKRQDINWDELMAWAEREGADLRVVEQVRAAASA
jgi:hypothetical protein